MFDEEAQRGHLAVLSGGEKRRDAVHVPQVQLGAGLQQHVADLQVAADHGFLQGGPSLNAPRVHSHAVVQQRRNNGRAVPLTGCREQQLLYCIKTNLKPTENICYRRFPSQASLPVLQTLHASLLQPLDLLNGQ